MNKDKQEPLPDMAQAEQILFYQDAPLSGSASFQEAAQSKANFAQRIPGTSEWTIGNGVGSLSQLTREEMAQKEKEESAEWFEEFSEVVDRVRLEEREREEWAQSKHKYAGIEMTGEEWGEFADRLKGDTPIRKWLLEKLRKEGKTEAQANEMADKVSLLAKMQSLPPAQWDSDMKALDQEMKDNPVQAKEIKENLVAVQATDASIKVGGHQVEQIAEVANASTETSIMAKADILSQSSGVVVATVAPKPTTYAASLGEPAFPTAPDLGEHHRAAMQAKQPLDTAKQVAALTPASTPAPTSPGGGFDV